MEVLFKQSLWINIFMKMFSRLHLLLKTKHCAVNDLTLMLSTNAAMHSEPCVECVTFTAFYEIPFFNVQFCFRKISIQLIYAYIKTHCIMWTCKYCRVTGLWAVNIPRLPVNSLQKGQWRGALMFSMICAGINGWVNNRRADTLRHHRDHYDVTVMIYICTLWNNLTKAWISVLCLNIPYT